MTLWDAMEATWPPARSWRDGPFIWRDGAGGGGRASAANAVADVGPGDALPPLVQVRAGQDALDAVLAGAGHLILRPTVLMIVPVATLTAVVPPPVSGFTAWPPLQIQRDIWAEGNIDTARQAVMDRVRTPRTALLGRCDDSAASAAFVALAGDVAFLHALEVRQAMRRRGAGRVAVLHAARWAAHYGARDLALAVARGNEAAMALYAGMGFRVADHYHYREETPHAG